MTNECSFAAVSVAITKVSGDEIGFTADAKAVGASAQSPQALWHAQGKFAYKVNEIFWPESPWKRGPPDPVAPISQPLSVGQSGWLYLKDVSLQTLVGKSSVGDCTVRGAFDSGLLPDEAPLRYKWPDCRAQQSWSIVDVVPSSLEIELADGTTLDLLDTSLVNHPQVIDWKSCSPLSLNLTAKGVKTVGNQGTTVWPVRMTVTGYINSGYKLTGKVDLRNSKDASVQQQFTIDGKKALQLRLTVSGFIEFGVIPTNLMNALVTVNKATVHDGALRDAIELVLGSLEALEALHHLPEERRKEATWTTQVDAFFRRGL
jgi:hypothetical protein